MREAGATARIMLVRGRRRKVGRAGRGMHRPESRSDPHADRAEARVWRAGTLAATQAGAEEGRTRFKPENRIALHRQGIPIYDLKDICTGKPVMAWTRNGWNGLCVDRASARCWAAKLRSCDDTEALKVAGVKQTVVDRTVQASLGFQAAGRSRGDRR